MTIDLEAEKSAEGTDPETGKAPAGDDGVSGEGAAAADKGSAEDAGKPESALSESDSPSEGDAASKGAGGDQSGSGTSPAEAEASAAVTAAGPTEESPKAETPEPATSGASGDREAPAPEPGTREQEDTAPHRTAPVAGAPQGGGGRGIVAGLVGGLVVAALVLGLQSAGILPAPRSRQAADVASKVTDLGTQVDGMKKSLAELKNSVAELENNPPQPPAGMSKAVSGLQAEVKSLADKLAGLQASTQSSGGVTASDLSRLKDGLARAGSRIDDLSKTVTGLKADVANASKETSLATIVAATALKSAIERGGPFAAELKVYQRIAANDQISAKLENIAGAGVSSRAALVQDFPDVADAILSAIRGNTANTGLFDRLVNSARSVIRIRPTGNVSGNAPSAIVARMETKLKAGNLKGVVDEWSSLPAVGRKASQSFIDRVKKRMTALQAADSALQDAMASTD